jgi:hypothetical protein
MRERGTVFIKRAETKREKERERVTKGIDGRLL